MFGLILLLGFVNADCVQGTKKCDNGNVVTCFGSGFESSWVLSEFCLGETPICSNGKCIGQIEFDAILEDATDSDLLDFGTLFMDIAAGEIWGTKEGIEYEKVGEDENRFSVVGEDVSLNIGGSSFNNLLSQDQAGHPSYLETDNFGNITKADFTVNENGGTYLINGIGFEVLGNSRVKYNSETGFEFPEGTQIKDIKSLQTNKNIPIQGTNLNFLDELFLDGSMSLNDEGYLIKSGKVIYEGMQINADSSAGEILIITTDKTKLLDYEENIIKKLSNGLRIESSKEGHVEIDFLENNKIFNVGENGKLKMVIHNGDSVELQKIEGLISQISHENNGGIVSIENNGLSFDLTDTSKVNIVASNVKIEDILNGNYKSVPCNIISNSPKIPEEIRINQYGEVKGTILRQISGGQFEEELIYTMAPSANILNNNLEHKDLEGIANSLKNNGLKDDTLDSVAYVAQEATKEGFNNEQTRNLILKVIDSSGDSSKNVLDEVSEGLFIIKDKITPEEFVDFTLENLDNIKLNSNNRETYADNLLCSYKILESGLTKEKDFELTKDFINEVIKYKKVSREQINYFSDGVKEYDGTNFGDIKNGIEITTKYIVYEDSNKKDVPFSAIPSFLDLSYSKIKDRQTLGEEYASALDKYFENTESINPIESQLASMGINLMHDSEYKFDNSDNLRKTIIENTGFKAKCYIIANSEGIDDLYTSTFEQIYETLPKDNLFEEIDKIDDGGDLKVKFLKRVAPTGNLPELFENDPANWRGVIEEAFNTDDQYALYDNTMFMEDTIEEILNSDKYPVEKENLEELFVKKYNEADTLDEKAKYAYLLKLNQNPLNDETKNILKNIPNIPPASIQEELGNTIASRSFYFNDETSYEDSIANYKSYGMTETYNDGHEARLTKVINGVTMIIDLEKNPVTLDSVPNVKEHLEGQFYNVGIGIRTHSYNKKKIFGDLTSDSAKMIYDGSCGGYIGTPITQKNFPNSYFISDQNIGHGYVTDRLFYETMVNIAKGKRDFKDIKPASAEGEGLIFPDKGNLQKYINMFINLYKNSN